MKDESELFKAKEMFLFTLRLVDSWGKSEGANVRERRRRKKIKKRSR